MTTTKLVGFVFLDVLRTLVGRDPDRERVTVSGWRVASLTDRVYPTLVPAPKASAPGDLLVDLSPTEWHILDAFEAEHYHLARVYPTGTAGHAWTYAASVLVRRNRRHRQSRTHSRLFGT